MNREVVSYHDIVECLSATLEAKDSYTEGHSSRVADMVCDVCHQLDISGDLYERIHLAAHMHDIGKVGVPDSVLNKNGKLNDEEWLSIKEHPVIGYKILMRSKNLEDMAIYIRHHHERFDGFGYPDGLEGEDIPLASRIICICDAIDAMLTDRSYRKAMDIKTCKEEVVKNSGSQFDPDLVTAIEPLWQIWSRDDKTRHRHD